MAQITTTQKIALSVEFKDRLGRPAQVDGTPEWGTDNSDVVALDVAGDGLSCVATAAGPIGSALVSVQADADLGDGVAPIAGTLQLDVVSAAAATVEITAGEPEEQ